MVIYLDMDGVLADFDAGIRALGIETDPTMNRSRSAMSVEDVERKTAIYLAIEARPGFFADLPALPDARTLWDWCAPYRPIILTAAPSSAAAFDRASSEKRQWIERQFGSIPDDRFVCTLSSHKRRYVNHQHGRFQILVDDRYQNCIEWSRAGGHSVLHRTAAESIRMMEQIMHPGLPAGVSSQDPVGAPAA